MTWLRSFVVVNVEDFHWKTTLQVENKGDLVENLKLKT